MADSWRSLFRHYDECHMIPLTRHYRTSMNRANKLLELPIPVVFSSATLATHAYYDLLKIMKLDYLSRIPVV